MKTEIRAILCDLDGVLTQTDHLHALAWKILFDEFFEEGGYSGQKEFGITTDYPLYVDGKPRVEGIRSFLKARGITLKEGDTGDDVHKFTVQALGKKKNEIFHKLLFEKGVKIYQPSIDAIRSWKEKGMKTAMVSSSKNSRKILELAGITTLFDEIVDGIVAEEENLGGKPMPDTFLYAAEKLKVTPGLSAVVEDAGVGIRAAKKGGFALAIGILRKSNREILMEAHPDVIVEDLQALSYNDNKLLYPQDFRKLRSAKNLNLTNPAFFFDYDGTLTPIVSRPEDAVLAPDTRKKLSELANLAPVTIISGRDKDDVKKLVAVGDLYYAGSHGLDIEGPGEVTFQKTGGRDFISMIAEIAEKLHQELKGFDGVQIERKKFAVAVHYRNVREEEHANVISFAQQLLTKYPQLRAGEGKMVMEIRPDIDWDKGKAMHWIAAKLNLDVETSQFVYVGDDITDEDALKAIPENGVGILVGDHGKATYADYFVDNAEEINKLLDRFIGDCKKDRK